MSQTSLFEQPAAGPDVTYDAGLLAGRFSMEALVAELPLHQNKATLYGKTFDAPRLECWFGDRNYQFGGRIETPAPWTPLAVKLREVVEKASGEAFDSCFVNYYRDGSDHIAWHSDDDDWIGPVIASVSFGACAAVRDEDEAGRRQGADTGAVSSW